VLIRLGMYIKDTSIYFGDVNDYEGVEIVKGKEG
jgi:hypothetical protein